MKIEYTIVKGHILVEEALETLSKTKDTKRKDKKVEKQGIDPCASCMLSTRSTI
jgi:hypothetical protein